MKIFITGATGFLGKYLVNELSPICSTIYVLTRNVDKSFFSHLSNVQLVAGDITQFDIISDKEKRLEILSECDFVIHAAALYDMQASHKECYLHNVLGTQNIIRLVNRFKSLKSFYYISTIAVGDDETFFLEENSLPARKKFRDFYSETKYHAEKMVRESNIHCGVRIIRPGIIVGDSVTGVMEKIDGPYYFIEAMKKYSLLLKGIPLLPLSFNPRTKIPLIPVDHCARAIVSLIKKDKGEKDAKTYHLISHELPNVLEFLNDLNQAFNLKTRYIPTLKNPFHDALLKLLGIPKEVVPFMFSKLSYDKTRTLVELPELAESRYSIFKDKLFGKTL